MSTDTATQSIAWDYAAARPVSYRRERREWSYRGRRNVGPSYLVDGYAAPFSASEFARHFGRHVSASNAPELVPGESANGTVMVIIAAYRLKGRRVLTRVELRHTHPALPHAAFREHWRIVDGAGTEAMPSGPVRLVVDAAGIVIEASGLPGLPGPYRLDCAALGVEPPPRGELRDIRG